MTDPVLASPIWSMEPKNLSQQNIFITQAAETSVISFRRPLDLPYLTKKNGEKSLPSTHYSQQKCMKCRPDCGTVLI